MTPEEERYLEATSRMEALYAEYASIEGIEEMHRMWWTGEGDGTWIPRKVIVLLEKLEETRVEYRKALSDMVKSLSTTEVDDSQI